MKHRLYSAVLVFCLAVILAAMGWVTLAALRLDRQQSEAGQRAAFEENVRLALWRMETAMAPLLARESSRPYFVYSSFYPAERAYTRMYEEIGPGEVLVPSPLLAGLDRGILLHFQFDPDGRLTSPQVPDDARLPAASAKSTPVTADAGRAERLREFGRSVSVPALRAALPPDEPQRRAAQLAEARPAAIRPPPAQQQSLAQTEAQQSVKNLSEWNARFDQQAAFQVNVPLAAPPGQASAGRASVEEGAMKPRWIGDTLLLARRISVNGRGYIQGCWLDWPALRGDLLAKVADLFPAAGLEPAQQRAAHADGRLLAALPLELRPGAMPRQPPAGLTPIRVALFVAWGCLLLTAGAVAGVLFGVISLGERRAAFTSAVTHELRTPLTTFRLYAEMLSEGMVPDEESRRHYLRALHSESLRLSHLVENVLAYARLEKGPRRRPTESTGLDAIIGRAGERLRQRAAQAGMALLLPDAASLPARPVRTDVAAVEQIVFNLVDNACKYAAGAADASVAIEVESRARHAVLRVRDRGPGIAPADARRLFKPFRKSAQRAAESAPGVGLGLALSRRLARVLGGDLRLAAGVRDGAAFELTIPWAE